MIKLRNGVLIPNLGLGTFLMNDDNETIRVINEAIEVGYRHFDTAQMYHNEHAIGQALTNSGLKREEYYITTKLMHHHSPEKTIELIEKSLKDLQTDYLDLLLIHWPNHDKAVNLSTWKIFERFYKSGKVKAIGVSNFTRFQLLELIKEADVIPHVNQVEHHPNLSQIPLKKFMDEYSINLMGYGPLMRGHLFDDNIKNVLEPIALNHNASIPQIAIAWGLHKGLIMIPKTVTKERLIQNFKAKDIKLTKEEVEKIDSINTGRRFYADPANNVYGPFKL